MKHDQLYDIIVKSITEEAFDLCAYVEPSLELTFEQFKNKYSWTPRHPRSVVEHGDSTTWYFTLCYDDGEYATEEPLCSITVSRNDPSDIKVKFGAARIPSDILFRVYTDEDGDVYAIATTVEDWEWETIDELAITRYYLPDEVFDQVDNGLFHYTGNDGEEGARDYLLQLGFVENTELEIV